jgi:hypothetical protein
MSLFDTKLQLKTENNLLEVDVSEDEQYIYDKIITEHPIEDGSSISDHEVKRPVPITLSGIVSNTPIGLSGIKKQVVGAVSNVQKRYNDEDTKNFAEQAYDILLQMYENSDVITLITGLTQIEDLRIKNLKFPRNANTTGGLFFTVTLQKIERVKNEEVQTTINNTASDINSDKQLDLGTQQKEEVRSSILSGIVNKVKNLNPFGG